MGENKSKYHIAQHILSEHGISLLHHRKFTGKNYFKPLAKQNTEINFARLRHATVIEEMNILCQGDVNSYETYVKLSRNIKCILSLSQLVTTNALFKYFALQSYIYMLLLTSLV